MLLPNRLERARVLTYGYSPSPDPNPAESKLNVFKDAERLLEALVDNRRPANGSSRPLILIAHGSGGLLCKKAILLSRTHRDTSYRTVFASLLGVAFMGTPHGGSWAKQWADIPASVLGLPATPKRSFLQALGLDRQVLEAIHSDFVSLVQDLGQGHCFEMVSFYEELPLNDALTKISTKEYVSLQRSTALQLKGNHIDMSRFNSIDDQGFQRVLGYLLRWTASTRSVRRETPSRHR